MGGLSPGGVLHPGTSIHAASAYKCFENEYGKRLIIMLLLFRNLLILPFKSLGLVCFFAFLLISVDTPKYLISFV